MVRVARVKSKHLTNQASQGPGPFTALASMHKSLDTVACRYVHDGLDSKENPESRLPGYTHNIGSIYNIHISTVMCYSPILEVIIYRPFLIMSRKEIKKISRKYQGGYSVPRYLLRRRPVIRG